MTAQFWGNPFDTLDGKRFIVDCSLRPSREFVVLMNWPLAQNRLESLRLSLARGAASIRMRPAFVPQGTMVIEQGDVIPKDALRARAEQARGDGAEAIVIGPVTNIHRSVRTLMGPLAPDGIISSSVSTGCARMRSSSATRCTHDTVQTAHSSSRSCSRGHVLGGGFGQRDAGLTALLGTPVHEAILAMYRYRPPARHCQSLAPEREVPLKSFWFATSNAAFSEATSLEMRCRSS